MSPQSPSAYESYTDDFFGVIARTSGDSAREVVPLIMKMIAPRSVADVGCGGGTWLAEFKRQGVDDIFGFDGPWVQRASLEIPPELFVTTDLEKPLAAPRRFELVVSLETAEHLPPESADSFVESLVKLGPMVLFSAAVPGQGGTRHLNEQWPAYWAQRFDALGYTVIDCIRPLLWENESVAWWYAQNMLLFVDRTHIERAAHLQEMTWTSAGSALAMVHPRLHLAEVAALGAARRQADLRQRWCGELLEAFPHVFARAVRNRLKHASSWLAAITGVLTARGFW